MHELAFLKSILVFLVAAICIVPAARFLRSSAVIGYLVAGLLVGPHVLGLVRDADQIRIWAEFGVVFLLFNIGLELSFERLKVLRTYVLGLGSLQVVVTAVIICGGVWLAGVPAEAAIVIGGALALSSTAFVLQMLVERGELAAVFGRVAFSILLLQDLAIVPLLALTPLLGESGPSIVLALGLATLKAVLAVAAALLLGRIVLRPLFRMVASAHSPELFVATALFVVLGSAYGMTESGLSMALGAFLAGVLLSGSEYRHQVEADIRPFRGLLLGLFFMFVGMSIDLSLVAQHWRYVALGLVALMLGKSVIIMVLCRAFGLPNDVALRVGPYLAQGGEFGFVLVGLGMSLGIVEPRLGAVVLAIVALSMAATPLTAWLGRLAAAAVAERGEPADHALPALAAAAGELSGHVLIAGFGRVGQTVAHVLASQGLAYVALDLDAPRVALCRKAGLAVFYGDASRIEVLEAAGASRARAAVITLDDWRAATRTVAAIRRHCPELPSFVRSRDRRHGRDLEQEGATAVVPETVEASLQLGSIVLTAIGTSRADVDQLLERLRSENYAALENIIDARREGEG